MDFIKQPMDIENKSMEIIAPHLAGLNLNEAETKVYSRMIHASGDVDYAQVIRLHPIAIEATQEALKRGANIYTDVEMVRTGINKKAFGRYGGENRVPCSRSGDCRHCEARRHHALDGGDARFREGTGRLHHRYRQRADGAL